jgi:hypothetical protein
VTPTSPPPEPRPATRLVITEDRIEGDGRVGATWAGLLGLARRRPWLALIALLMLLEVSGGITDRARSIAGVVVRTVRGTPLAEVLTPPPVRLPPPTATP